MPLLPFLRALGLMVGVQEQSPAEGAPAALAAQQVPGRRVHREAVAACPALPRPHQRNGHSNAPAGGRSRPSRTLCGTEISASVGATKACTLTRAELE
ncbi:MAG: hypothetical protein ACRDOU_30895, partial [Streptosporangiaceae bacterium]